MWKEYIETIKSRDINYNHQEYCLWFSCYFSLTIKPIDEISQYLERENGELLPISKNLTDAFFEIDIETIVNLIYHLNDLKCLDFLIMESEDTVNLNLLFSDKDNQKYIFNLFSFDFELLLENQSNNSSLLFLFFYFLPQHKRTDSLYHSIKKIPLISCNKISFNNFQMLLFLMKEYNVNTFEGLCKNYNLNLFLLEDFCKSANDIYTFLENEDWYDILPIEKMKILFKENCHFNKYNDFKDKVVYYTVPTLSRFLKYFQKELEFLSLKEKLNIKIKLPIKYKIIKI